MLNSKKKNEYGAVEVEATLILPMIIMIVILSLYISLFICQRAILQANLETAAMYYRNSLTDTFVNPTESMGIYEDGDTETRKGSTYTATRPLNPYRGIMDSSKRVSKVSLIASSDLRLKSLASVRKKGDLGCPNASMITYFKPSSVSFRAGSRILPSPSQQLPSPMLCRYRSSC